VRELRTALPEARAVLLMGSAKREAVVEAFRAGARGIFSKDQSVETLSKCVRNVHEGQIWASNEQMAFAVEALAASPNVRAISANGLDLLSKREMDVVRCLADGLTNREIAERLGLSQHTIKNYLFRVFDKLGVSSRMELLFLTLSQPQPATPSRLDATRHNGNAHALETGMAGLYKAAEEGIPSAQIELARMHSEGRKVAKDAVTAYMWYLIAERTSLELKDEITSAKRKLAGILTAEEMLEAQKQAGEKLKRLPKTAPLPSSGAAPNRLNL
jgi:DNA-binding CsgD family transcriptional regulator